MSQDDALHAMRKEIYDHFISGEISWDECQNDLSMLSEESKDEGN